MTGATRDLLVFMALALAGGTSLPAAPPAGIEGVYATRQMEMASALRLTPDGRFDWYLSYGALDLAGAGRWSRGADGGLLLNSEPAYVAPRFEPAGKSRDGKRGLLVHVTDERGKAPNYLEALVEYEDGGRETHYLEEGAHRFAEKPGRRIVAVQLGSRAFDFISKRFAVDTDANVMRFRFFPNDLGRADFRDLAVSVEPDALSFTWRGETLRYVRESDEGLPMDEQAETPADAAGAEEPKDGAEGDVVGRPDQLEVVASGPGLWIGPIRLCRDRVKTVSVDEPLGGGHAVTIAVPLSLAPDFERESGRLIGGPVPVSIDGRVVARPIVRERISTAITFGTESEQDAVAIREAAVRAC
jgi:hypothetical protein